VFASPWETGARVGMRRGGTMSAYSIGISVLCGRRAGDFGRVPAWEMVAADGVMLVADIFVRSGLQLLCDGNLNPNPFQKKNSDPNRTYINFKHARSSFM